MSIDEVAALIKAVKVTQGQALVKTALATDALSWAMSRGAKDSAWITIETHMNVIALAKMREFACVILPDGVEMEERVLDKARDENIAVLYSPLSAHEICGRLYSQGIV